MLFLLTILLALVCVVGDSVLLMTGPDIVKALVDNCTHSLVAVISWFIILIKCHLKSSLIRSSLFELLLCGFIASIIDIDHFILANSLNLKVCFNYVFVEKINSKICYNVNILGRRIWLWSLNKIFNTKKHFYNPIKLTVVLNTIKMWL